jgi:two-component system phosphate regulon sensor histidine kinase PhoR
MQKRGSPRLLVSYGILGLALILTAVGLGILREAQSGVWLAIGAFASAAFLFGVIWRLSAIAQEWSKELRTVRGELRKTRESLSKSQNEFHVILDTFSSPIFICDEGTTVIQANNTAKQIFDFEEPIGRTILEITLSHELQQLIQTALQLELPIEQELSISHPKDRVFYCVARSINSKKNKIALCMTDITELRKLENIRSDFVANASHELRTPMASIRAIAETLKEDEKLDEEQKQKFLSRIMSEVDRLSNLTNDLLVLSTAESKPQAHDDVDFSMITREATQSMKQQFSEKNLKLNVQIESDIFVSGDVNQLIQVIVNLLSNALRYTPEGEVNIKLFEKDNHAVLEVQDTGIGISSEHLPRIFERFYRVDRARSRETGGTGLGLSIVKHIIESHNGTIEVESELNAGSTFRVQIPLLVPKERSEPSLFN